MFLRAWFVIVSEIQLKSFINIPSDSVWPVDAGLCECSSEWVYGERSQQRAVRMSGEQTHMQYTNITSDVIRTKHEKVKNPCLTKMSKVNGPIKTSYALVQQYGISMGYLNKELENYRHSCMHFYCRVHWVNHIYLVKLILGQYDNT